MKNLLKSFIILFAVISTASAQSRAAAVDFYLELEGITGESLDPGHEGDIKIDSFKAGVQQKFLLNFAGGGGGAGKSDFLPVKIFKMIDKTSPEIFLKCATGQHIPKAVVYARYVADEGTPGGPVGDFFKITLFDVIVASINGEAAELDGSKTLLESVTLSYAKIEWSYRPVNAEGQLGAEVKAGYDVKANKKL